MADKVPVADPCNLIITGVGGQGNVLASRIVGNMLTRKGYYITIGETFGASQRGGSVMSHLRISSKTILAPQLPKGKAHMVVALEPTEALRAIKDYGNPGVKVITNTRPIHSVGVISGELQYPDMNDLKQWLDKYTAKTWFIDATDQAVQLGNPILGNVMLVGSLAAATGLPLDKDTFREVIALSMPADKIDINVTAFERGMKAIQ